MEKIIEGLWDCTSCGTHEIGGSKRECPNCGKPRGNDVAFYLKGQRKYVEHPETINKNPDWLCNYCQNLSPASATHCLSCGSPKKESTSTYFDMKRDKDVDPSHTVNENTIMSRVSIWNIAGIIGIILFVLASIGSIIYLFSPKTDTLTISDFSWERNIEIQKYQTVNESGWYLPNGARLQTSQSEVYTYTKVIDHYVTKTKQVQKQRLKGYESYSTGVKDMGNGYFKETTGQRPVYETYYETESYQEPVYRNDPVYKTKYYYEIDKWLFDKDVPTEGKDHQPYWGEIQLEAAQRISTQSETYAITAYNSKGESKEYTLPYDQWINLALEQQLEVIVHFNNSIEIVGPVMVPEDESTTSILKKTAYIDTFYRQSFFIYSMNFTRCLI